MARSSVVLVAALALFAPSACTKSQPAPKPPAADAADATPPFQNPGGMWMPSQLASHAQTLESLGVEFDPAALTDPTAFPLAAIVSLGGCSASFVSPEGLIITNHHCVTGQLQHNSTPEKNLLVEGYLARTRADELPGGPKARVYVTSAFTDVTEQMVAGTAEIAADDARADELHRREAKLEAECEAKKADTRCTVASYFDGAQFYLIEQLAIRDVRLVYAPHSGVGVFGGEVDNWRWPRHTGDYSFLRAYVGKDGRPADPSADNVPYRPPHHLKVASTPLKPGDFAMVAGYPGSTYRLKTAAEVGEAVEWRYPRDIARYDSYIALYTEMGKRRPELAIKAASRLRGLSNYRTNFQGMLDGLSAGGLAKRKAATEADLRKWIDADPGRKASYGDVLPQMDALAEARKAHRDHDAVVQEIAKASPLLGIAAILHEVARERSKPEAERTPGFDTKKLAEVESEIESLAGRYDAELDAALLGLALRRAAALPDGQRPDAMIEALVGKAAQAPLDEAKLDKALAKLFAKTRLADPGARDKLLAKATSGSQLDPRDPVLAAYARMRPVLEEVEKREKAYEGAMAKLRPKYVAALRELSPGPIAPDANGTLRVTYGTVRGYRPRPDAEEYAPFTTVSQMVAKHTGEDPFAAPTGVLEAARAKAFGPYLDQRIGDLPLDFLADLDITGGNSGSATLNGKGELIGLAFDGNYEAIASDWVFIPEVTRSIHVDIRYVLWMMDAVDGADHLVSEMGVTPAIDPAKAATPPAAAPAPATAAAPAPAAAAG
jgi:hypothetical protein